METMYTKISGTVQAPLAKCQKNVVPDTVTLEKTNYQMCVQQKTGIWVERKWVHEEQHKTTKDRTIA